MSFYSSGPAGRLGFSSSYGWDAAWRAAQGKLATSPAVVSITGASAYEGGSVVTDVMSTSVFPRLRVGLLKRNPTLYGDFFTPMYSSNFSNDPAPNGWPWVFGVAPDSWAYNAAWFTPKFTTHNGTSGAPLMTFHMPALGYSNLSGDIVVWDDVAGTLNLNLNGGATIPIALTGSKTLIRLSFNSSTAGWVNGNNVVNIWQSASGVAAVVGMCCYPAAGGPPVGGYGFVWAAFSGMTINELVRTDLGSKYRAEVLVGPTVALPTADSPSAGWPITSGFGFPFNRSLCIMGMFDDPLVYDVPGATAAVNPTLAVQASGPEEYENYLDRARASDQAIQASTLQLITNIPTSTTSDIYMNVAGVQNGLKYVQAHYRVATVRNCGILSEHIGWGERAHALGYMNPGDFHPNDAGHQAMANDILAVI